YLGDLRFDDIRPLLFDDASGAREAGEFATKDPKTLGLGLRPAEVLDSLDDARDGALPVVDGRGTFLGYLWREAALNEYRRLMIAMTKD
ncbi:MAG TPA: CBS domain-containing protein, partial [Spirochaetales bacterium]|nr:CBS domain-containing protein [Spirochaetales bacterium]